MLTCADLPLPAVAQSDSVDDLRSALRSLESASGQLVRTDLPIEPGANLVITSHTNRGLAMLYQNVDGYPGVRIATGVTASRDRVAFLLDTRPESLGFKLLEAVDHPIAPVLTEDTPPLCQQIVFDPAVDFRAILPIPSNGRLDRGPSCIFALVCATDPETGERAASSHRICARGPNMVGMLFPSDSSIGALCEKAGKMNRALPISINIGLDPATTFVAGFGPPSVPSDFDRLSVAGGLRGRAIEMAQCIAIDERSIAHAEVVIEGEILPNPGMDPGIHNRFAIPHCSAIRVKAVTTRKDPIFELIAKQDAEPESIFDCLAPVFVHSGIAAGA